MTEVRFTVPGILPGWQRAGGNGSRRFTQEQTRNAEAEVAAWGRQAMAGRQLLAGPLGMELTLLDPIPESWSAAKRAKMAGQWVTVKPDGDNRMKLALDALNGVCYRDDAQIAQWAGCKRYVRDGEKARAEVTITTLDRVEG